MRNRFGRLSDTALDFFGAFLIVIVVALIATTAFFAWQVHTIVTQHNGDLARIEQLAKTTDATAHKYLAEQNALAKAGKEQAAFAEWLIQAQSTICSAVKADCPAVPDIGVK